MDAAAALGLATPSPGALGGSAARTPAETRRVAEEFEATFLASMLGVMFQGVKPQAPFHGGAGEDAFQSFLTDAMAKSVARAGGIGLADSLSRELLKLQEMEAA